MAARLPTASRARLIACIRAGGVAINGRPGLKPSSPVQAGDVVTCVLAPPPASRALPEEIPLSVAYEDAHVLVVDKPAGLVVHPCPSQPAGTLVNALLHHCQVGPVELGPDQLGPGSLLGGDEEDALDSDDDEGDDGGRRALRPGLPGAGVIRPGIVHRIDKGTTGLLVIAKTEEARVDLVQQVGLVGSF